MYVIVIVCLILSLAHLITSLSCLYGAVKVILISKSSYRKFNFSTGKCTYGRGFSRARR